jgi:hypothetical protein
MSEMKEKEVKLEEYYKKLLSTMILKVFYKQQKIIDELNHEIIQLKMQSQNQSTITYNQNTNIFTDKTTGKLFRLDRSFDDSDSDSE